MKIYSIKNEKLNFFNRPIYCESESEALSYIQNVLMSDADRALLGLKDDLSLYELGEIDFQTGIIIPLVCFRSDDDPGEPLKICSLREIFDSIPVESIKRLPDRDEFFKFVDEFKSLSNDVKTLYEKIDNLGKEKKRK